MVAVNKQICKQLLAKGKWNKAVCGLCNYNPITCGMLTTEYYEEDKNRNERDLHPVHPDCEVR